MYDKVLSEIEESEDVQVEKSEMTILVQAYHSVKVQETIKNMGGTVTDVQSRGPKTFITFKV